MARLTAPDGRSRIPLLIATGVLLLALVSAGAYLLGRGQATTATAAPTSAAATSNSPDPLVDDGSDDPAPTGCLGGQDRTPQMVLAAQRAAGHSTFGAVEVAAAIFRWGYRYPYPATSEVQAVRGIFDPRTATKQIRDFSRDYSRSTYAQPRGGAVAEGTPFYVTTANGVWGTDATSTASHVLVTVQTHYVLDDSYRVNRTAAITFGMTWTADAWHLTELQRVTGPTIGNGGTSFTTGC